MLPLVQYIVALTARVVISIAVVDDCAQFECVVVEAVRRGFSSGELSGGDPYFLRKLHIRPVAVRVFLLCRIGSAVLRCSSVSSSLNRFPVLLSLLLLSSTRFFLF